MPMDYDDSDPQTHIFRVISDEVDEFPVSSGSFPLPRFDLDEQLQAHLRFDNLIEPEDFFGVQGQESNWIEGISSGNAAIGLISSAAESCSISRTNNVWSEATSTESVEMLLKSVGEGDIAHNMDDMNGNTDEQLMNMEQFIDQFQIEAKSSNSWTNNVLEMEINNDQSQSSPSSVTEGAAKNKNPMDSMLSCSIGGLDDESFILSESCDPQDASVGNVRISDDQIPSSSGDAIKDDNSVGYYDVVSNECTLVKLDSESGSGKGELAVENVFLLDPVMHAAVNDGARVRSFVDADNSVKLGVGLLPQQIEQNCEMDGDFQYVLQHDKLDDHEIIGCSKCNTGAAEFSRDVIQSRTGSLGLESSMDPVNLLKEREHQTLFPGNSDGLLEAIAYPVKSPNETAKKVDTSTCTGKALLVSECSEDIMEFSVDGNEPRIRDYNGNERDTEFGCCQAGTPEMFDSLDDNAEKILGRNEVSVMATHSRHGEAMVLNSIDNTCEESSPSYIDSGQAGKVVGSESSDGKSIEPNTAFGSCQTGSSGLIEDAGKMLGNNGNVTVMATHVRHEETMVVDSSENTCENSSPSCTGAEHANDVLSVSETADAKSNEPNISAGTEATKAFGSFQEASSLTISSEKESAEKLFGSNEIVSVMTTCSRLGESRLVHVSDSTCEVNLTSCPGIEQACKDVVGLDTSDAKRNDPNTSDGNGLNRVLGCCPSVVEDAENLVGSNVNVGDMETHSSNGESMEEHSNDNTCEGNLPTGPVSEQAGNVKAGAESADTKSNASDGIETNTAFGCCNAGNSVIEESAEKLQGSNEIVSVMPTHFRHGENMLHSSNTCVEDLPCHDSGQGANVVVGSEPADSLSTVEMSELIPSSENAVNKEPNMQHSVDQMELDTPTVDKKATLDTLNCAVSGLSYHCLISPDTISSQAEKIVMAQHLTDAVPFSEPADAEKEACKVQSSNLGGLSVNVSSSQMPGICSEHHSDSALDVSKDKEHFAASVEESQNQDPAELLPKPSASCSKSSYMVDSCVKSNSKEDAGSAGIDEVANHSAEDHTVSSIRDIKSELAGDRSGHAGEVVGASGSPVGICCAEPHQPDTECKLVSPDHGGTPLLAHHADEVCHSITSGSEGPPLENNPANGDDGSLSFDLRGTEVSEKNDNSERESLKNTDPDRDTSSAGPEVSHDALVCGQGFSESDANAANNTSEGAPVEMMKQAHECPMDTAEKLTPKKKKRQGGQDSSNSSISDTSRRNKSQMVEVQPSSVSCNDGLVRLAFTDNQHVQLRAQIFVYGALIQGIPPREEYMVSAFGEHADGGRAVWESVWHASIERFHNQSSPFNVIETPNSSRLGSWAAEQASKKSSVAKQKTTARAAGKNARAANAIVPFGLSKLQSGTQLDFCPAVSSGFTYNSPQTKQPTGISTPLVSQSPRPTSWLVSPQNVIFDSSAQLTLAPTIGPAKVPSSKSPDVNTPVVQVVSPGTLLPVKENYGSCSSVIVVDSQRESETKSSSISQKQRKRRKGIGNDKQILGNQIPDLKMESASDTLLPKHSIAPFTLSAITPMGVACGAVLSTSDIVSTTVNQGTGCKIAEHRVTVPDIGCTELEEARISSNNASICASAAANHSHDTWTQLAVNNKDELPCEVQEKLASAAAAAAAAASVSKAAAEAAKIASEAALQAKLMAEEAITSVKIATASDTADGTIENEKLIGPNSFIYAARELSRKRAEAASAAAKRAENLDAILKAAEQAAEAVSQAGAIIAMGDPLPFTLSELLQAGPDRYWKQNCMNTEKSSVVNCVPVVNILEVAKNDDRAVSSARGLGSVQNHEGQKVSESTPYGDKQEPGCMIGNTSSKAEDPPMAASTKIHGFQKGSLVEVAADKGVWYSAKVLDVTEDKMLISYNDRREDEGADYLKEWIPLEYESGKVPKVRIAHPATSAKFEGTRKRRRDNAATCNWAVGDHVDAWIKDSWWDGIVAEKCEGIDSKYSVNFPAHGESFVVDAWNLRTSLVWKDGRWTQWVHGSEKNSQSHKGDTPYEKRRRVGEREEFSGSGDIDRSGASNILSKPGEAQGLNLSTNDVVFSIGKSTTESRSGAVAPKRTGLQSGGSRVVIGVPRPGKKRKFMEVSKHYVSDKPDRVTDGPSVKTALHSNLQASGQGERVFKGDTRAKRTNETKSKSVKLTRSQESLVGTTAETEHSSAVAASSGSLGNASGLISSLKKPVSNDISGLEKMNAPGSTNPKDDGPVKSSSHLQPVPGSSIAKQNNRLTGSKRNIAPKTSDNLTRHEPKTAEGSENMSSSSIEPRRSNRRIQPTSRLLEGLQSSLIISRASGERGAKGFQRTTASTKGKERG